MKRLIDWFVEKVSRLLMWTEKNKQWGYDMQAKGKRMWKEMKEK